MRRRSRFSRLSPAIAIVSVWLPLATHGQQTQPAPPPPPPPPSQPAAPPSAPAPPIFSGTLFANYQYRADAGPAKASNKFDVDRVHLIFRMPAGDRGSIRVVTDVFQQTNPASDAFFRGWVVRAKFAYFQYDYIKRPDWNAVVRAGLIQTIFIDHEETFWTRWIALTAVERAAYFIPGDAGVGTVVTLPKKRGEFHATITNGPGFNSRETDRFKDYAARLSLTPLALAKQTFLRSLTITGWTYHGAAGSRFAAGGAGQTGPVGSALSRQRWGVFAGLKDPRLTLGAQYASRTNGFETGDNTSASPRIEADSSGHLVSAYALARPFQLLNATSKVPLGLVVRRDYVKPNGNSPASYRSTIAGIAWDLTSRASVSLDYQQQIPADGASIDRAKTYYAHLIANF